MPERRQRPEKRLGLVMSDAELTTGGQHELQQQPRKCKGKSRERTKLRDEIRIFAGGQRTLTSDGMWRTLGIVSVLMQTNNS